MGFLDHSTNNIIVDAVLTDHGRQALANNDGSFHIFSFSLGDDEVDYNVIKQYGRTVGKEKIEKNTPVMEALTHSNLALKYPLISVSNEFLTHVPVMSLKNTSTVTFDRKSNSTTGTLDFTLENKTGIGFEQDMLVSEVIVEVPHTFVGIQGLSPDSVSVDNVATYTVPVSTQTSGAELTVSIPLVTKSVSETTFDLHTASGATQIEEYVTVTATNTGATMTTSIVLK